jgi:hypothetical protein
MEKDSVMKSTFKSWRQVFINNLSILDLLFNEGKFTIDYLREQQLYLVNRLLKLNLAMIVMIRVLMSEKVLWRSFFIDKNIIYSSRIVLKLICLAKPVPASSKQSFNFPLHFYKHKSRRYYSYLQNNDRYSHWLRAFENLSLLLLLFKGFTNSSIQHLRLTLIDYLILSLISSTSGEIFMDCNCILYNHNILTLLYQHK